MQLAAYKGRAYSLELPFEIYGAQETHRLNGVHQRRATAADAAGAIPVSKQHSCQSKQRCRQTVAERHTQRIAASTTETLKHDPC